LAYKSGSRAVVIYKHISLYIPCSICDDDDIVTQSLVCSLVIFNMSCYTVTRYYSTCLVTPSLVCSLVIIQHVLLHWHSSVHSLLFNMSCYTVTRLFTRYYSTCLVILSLVCSLVIIQHVLLLHTTLNCLTFCRHL